MSFGINVADPSSGGKYADGAYHTVAFEGNSRFYGARFVGAYDFYYDAALGDGRQFIDCSGDGISLGSGVADEIVRCTFLSANLSRHVTSIDGFTATTNFGINPTEAGAGFTFSDLTFVGSPDYATRVSGRPFFLYQWDTSYGNSSNYLMNVQIPIPSLQGTNIVKAFQFDLQSTSNTPNGVIWLGFTNNFIVKDNLESSISGAVIGCKDADGSAGWLSGKDASYPYNPTFIFAKTSDANGLVENTSVIKGRIQWNGQTTLANAYGAWSSGYPNNPWSINCRKYGYLEGTAVLNPDNSQGKQSINLTLLENPTPSP